MTWPTTRLKNVAQVRVSNVDKKSVVGEPEVRLCNYVDVYKNDAIRPDMELMRATASVDQVRTFRVVAGDTLITKDSETSNDIAVPAFVAESSPDMVCGYHLALVRPSQEVHPKYLYWALTSLRFQTQMTALATGVTRFGLRHEAIGNGTLPVPPMEDQRRIADFLDAETARIDGLLTKREQQLSTLAERVGALISEALIPGTLAAPAKRHSWPWLPEALHDRPLTKLGYVSRLQNGLTVDGQRQLEGDVVTRPYLRVANVQAGSLDLKAVSEITVSRRVADRSTLRRGDVLMTEGGDLDKLGRGTVWRDEIPGCLHQNHVFAIRPDHARLVPEFLAYMTQTVHGRSYFESTGSRTTNLASTNSYKIMAFPIPLPPVATQRRIVASVDSVVENVDEARTLIERQRSLLRERRQALITAAVTGCFEVSAASGRGVVD